MATPLILVLMGGQVDFSAVGAMKKELIVGIVQRLILAPVIGFCLAFGRPGSGRVYPHPRNCGYSGRGVWFTGCLSQRGHGGGDGRRRRAGPAVCCLDMRPEYADAAAVDCFSSGICLAVTEKYGEKYRDYRTSGRKSSISCEIVCPFCYEKCHFPGACSGKDRDFNEFLRLRAQELCEASPAGEFFDWLKKYQQFRKNCWSTRQKTYARIGMAETPLRAGQEGRLGGRPGQGAHRVEGPGP